MILVEIKSKQALAKKKNPQNIPIWQVYHQAIRLFNFQELK